MYFVYLRRWIGFGQAFPYAEFESHPAEDLEPAIRAAARRWGEANPAAIAEYRREAQMRANGSMLDVTGRRSAPRPPPAKDSPPTFNEVWNSAPGWRRGHLFRFPTPREYVAEFVDEESAKALMEILQERHHDELPNFRFAVVRGEDLGAAKCMAIRLAIEDARRACGVTGTKHSLLNVFLDIDRILDAWSAESGSPATHEIDTAPRKKAGRPREHDPSEDRKLVKALEDSGLKPLAFARQENIPIEDIRLAQARVRGRKKPAK